METEEIPTIDYMVITPDGLSKLLKLLKFGVFTSVSCYHPCPVCRRGRFPGEQQTMRIFPDLRGDFIYRCHICGGNYDTLELAAKVLNLPFHQAAWQLEGAGVASRSYTDDEITRTVRLGELREYTDADTRGLFAEILNQRKVNYFGEWTRLSAESAGMYFGADLAGVRSDSRPIDIRIQRNIFGRAVELVLCKPAPLAYATFTLQGKEPLVFSMSPWSRYCDLKTVILCTSNSTARVVQEIVSGWSSEQQVPVLHAERMDFQALAYRLPFENVIHVIREDESPVPALAFGNAPYVRVQTKVLAGTTQYPGDVPSQNGCHFLLAYDLQDPFSRTASYIVEGSSHDLSERLNSVLAGRAIPDQTKRSLLLESSKLLGKSVPELLDMADVGSNPFCVNIKGKRFVCRNGVYFMGDVKDRWQTISNFSIRIVKTETGTAGDSRHELLLSVEGKLATFWVTAALLDNHNRLWRESQRAGALAGLPLLIMPNGQHRRLLPSLIKRTCRPPAIPQDAVKPAQPNPTTPKQVEETIKKAEKAPQEVETGVVAAQTDPRGLESVEKQGEKAENLEGATEGETYDENSSSRLPANFFKGFFDGLDLTEAARILEGD